MDVEWLAAPTCFDVDGDGDHDCVVGNEYGNIKYLRNWDVESFCSIQGAFPYRMSAAGAVQGILVFSVLSGVLALVLMRELAMDMVPATPQAHRRGLASAS